MLSNPEMWAYVLVIAAAVFSGMLAISSMIGAARGAKEN